jgi:hypothetical protein
MKRFPFNITPPAALAAWGTWNEADKSGMGTRSNGRKQMEKRCLEGAMILMNSVAHGLNAGISNG